MRIMNMPIYFAFLFMFIGAGTLHAQQGKLPPLPGSEKSKSKPADNLRPSDTTEGVTEVQENSEYLIGMAAAMKNMVLSAIKDALFVVKQDYYIEDGNGNKTVSPGKDYFGRKYGIAVAANGRLWTMSSQISPWLADEGFSNVSGVKTPVRSTTGVRRLDDFRSFKNQTMVAHVENNLYVGYYDYPEPIRYASISKNLQRTEGRLILFYVNNGEDPETAEVQAKVFNIDPDWNTKGMIRNPLPDYSDKLFLGGVYVVEESPQNVAPPQANEQPKSGRSSRGKSQPTETAKTEGPALGTIQFKVVGLYQRQGNDKYIVTLPAEIEMKAEGGEAQESQSSRSSRSGRSGRSSRSRR
ncbi:MAG: hypothetical protein R2787_03880 [Saprospiraceae bacterium]